MRLCWRRCRCLWRHKIRAWSNNAPSLWSSWCLMETQQWVRILHTYPLILHTHTCNSFTNSLTILSHIIHVGEIKLSTIQKNIKRAMRPDISLFSLGIGFDVDFDFLQRIALENRGMAQRIYANHDASEQMKVPKPHLIHFLHLCKRAYLISIYLPSQRYLYYYFSKFYTYPCGRYF